MRRKWKYAQVDVIPEEQDTIENNQQNMINDLDLETIRKNIISSLPSQEWNDNTKREVTRLLDACIKNADVNNFDKNSIKDLEDSIKKCLTNSMSQSSNPLVRELSKAIDQFFSGPAGKGMSTLEDVGQRNLTQPTDSRITNNKTPFNQSKRR